jgi:hypothetical protein
MGKATKLLKAFINGIPDHVLIGISTNPGKIWADTDFRLDMQGMTSAQQHNLQVQINNGTTISTLKKFAPQTVAGPVLAPSDDSMTPAEIRAQLLAKMLV